jgi:hypothetical protein
MKREREERDGTPSFSRIPVPIVHHRLSHDVFHHAGVPIDEEVDEAAEIVNQSRADAMKDSQENLLPLLKDVFPFVGLPSVPLTISCHMEGVT